MPDGETREQERARKAALRERLTAPEREWHKQDVAFWRAASDEVRGRTLYELLARGEGFRAGVGSFPQEKMCMILHPGWIEIVPRE